MFDSVFWGPILAVLQFPVFSVVAKASFPMKSTSGGGPPAPEAPGPGGLGGGSPPGEPILRMRFFAIIVSPPYEGGRISLLVMLLR